MPKGAASTKRSTAKSKSIPARTPVPVDGLPGQDKITTLTVINSGQQVTIASSKSGKLEIRGQITGAEGGVYQKHEQAILVGFEGEIRLPRTIDLRLEQSPPRRAQDLVARFAPSLARRPVVQLACPVREVKTAADLAAFIQWTTQPSDANYYLGAYPSKDPMVLSYLEKLAGTQRFYEHQALRRAAKRGPGEARLVRIGRAVQNLLETTQEGLDHMAQMHEGAQACVVAPEEVMTMACAAFAHGVRADVTREVLREKIQSVDDEMRAQLDKEEKEKPAYWGAMVSVPIGLVACAAGLVGMAVVRDREAAKEILPKALAGAAVAIGAVAVLGTPTCDVVQSGEHDANVAQLREKAASVHFAREALAQYDREGTFTDTVSEVIRIVGEDDERIKGEWERANSPEERRQIITKVEARMDAIEAGGRAPSTLVTQYVQAARAKNYQRMAGILIDISEIRNAAFQAARKALGGRMDAVVGGFAKGAIPHPKDLPAWMQA